MRQSRISHLTVLIALFAATGTARAAGNGVSGGLSLIDAGGARAAALSEAFSAASDDANAFLYNPANLTTLSLSHASLYYRGSEEDERHGRFTVAVPGRRTGFGLSVATYNSGTIEANDGTATRTVTAQSDLSAALGGGVEMGPVSLGFTGKYLSSELVEQAKAQAFAFDAGLGLQLNKKFRLGGAVQNMGGELRYQNSGDPLPRIARMGLSYQLPFSALSTVLLDVPYFMNEKDTRPSLALETFVGPMALRGGVRRSDEIEYSVGAGFALNRISFDYAFAATGFNTRHEAGLSFRFGNPRGYHPHQVKALEAPVAPVVSAPVTPAPARRAFTLEPMPTARVQNNAYKGPRVYIVKEGDTLAAIAKQLYGNPHLWTMLLQANRHLIKDASEIEVGQRLVLPQ